MFGGPNFFLAGGAIPRPAIALTIAASTANYNIFSNKGGTYVAGKSDVTLTINPGVNVYSTSVGTPGLTVGGFATGDTVKIINNGTIAGKGGDGSSGEAGGTALSTGFAVSITNNGTVQGGGGGGSSKGGSYQCYCGQEHQYGSGGGGGGAGINAGTGGGGGGGACGDGGPGCPGGPVNGGAGGYAYYDGPGNPGGNRGAAGSYGAGSCTVGNAFITWTVVGNRYGPLN
jgi:hypothetical protein